MIDWNVKNLVNFFHERNFVWICDALIWRILFDVMNIPLAELVLSLAVLPVVVNIFGQRCKRREMTKWWNREKCVWRFEFYIRLCFKSKLCLSSSPILGSEYIIITLIFLNFPRFLSVVMHLAVVNLSCLDMPLNPHLY